MLVVMPVGWANGDAAVVHYFRMSCRVMVVGNADLSLASTCVALYLSLRGRGPPMSCYARELCT
jgi:hypothetical protein